MTPEAPVTPAKVLVLIPATAAIVPVPPAVHKHFFNLGQFMGLGMLALLAYHQQDVAPDGAAVLLNPAVASPYLQGIMSLFPPPAE
jgi:hypothetical protein